MRALIPGFITIDIEYRSDGTLPGHTKSYFAKYDILTIQNVIVLNALVFMHKARICKKNSSRKLALPRCNT